MPLVDHVSSCSTEPKMVCNYNYVIRVDGWMWRPKPRFLLNPYKRYPKLYFPVSPSLSALPRARDQQDIVECFDTPTHSASLHSKPFLDDLSLFGNGNGNEQHTVCANHYPIEEPWLLLHPEDFNFCLDGNATLNPHQFYHPADVDFNSSSSLYAPQFPSEDPWLLYDHPSFDQTHVPHASNIIEPAEDEQSISNPQEHHLPVPEKLISGKESFLQDSVSTEILINCSICTMQRIAVLEDGNLVELLLEPVKNNVQCDSVYVGIVTKLVPHMGGAFVNIGSARPSLMDIKHNREPFIFPPFGCTVKEKDVNGMPSSMLDKQLDSNQNGQALIDEDGATLSDEDSDGEFEDDFLEDHASDDDMDVEEVQMKNCTSCSENDNGTVADVGSSSRLNGNENLVKVQSDRQVSHVQQHRNTKNIPRAEKTWAQVRKGTKIVVQVVKEGLGTKGPTLTAYPKLRSRFWVLLTRCNSIGVSKKISGVERTRLRVIAKSLQPPGFGVTVRTVASGHSMEELWKDLEDLLSTWRNIMEHAKSAALAADEGVEGAVPVILHQAMGQTLSVVQDYFSEKVKRMVVDSPRTYHEVTNYLQDIAPDLCDRVELHREKTPLFDGFNIEEEINNILNKRVSLPNGGSLVIEQTEALVSIDVNGGHGMFGQGVSQEKAILDVNLAAAKQIARELRLRDIGGIIVVDFIDMMDDSNKRLVYEEVRKAVERDRSMVKVSELSKHGLMEITRKRVRPSVTFMISEPCTCCHGTGRVEALDTSFSKIEHEICRLLATLDQSADPANPKSWPRLLLRVDSYMCDYLTSGKRTRLANLSSSLKVWILLKVARSFTRGAFEVKLLTDELASNNHNQVGVAMLQEAGETPVSPKRIKLFPVKKWKAGRKL